MSVSVLRRSGIFYRTLRHRLSDPVAFALAGMRPASYIAAWPRSGSTWLRTLLSSVRRPESDGDPEVFNREIPGVALRQAVSLFNAPEPRLLMSHSMYRRQIPRAVYVLRDGRDSIASFYHYTTTRQGQPMLFDDWYALYLRGAFGDRWDQNVESWLRQGREVLGDNLMVQRFEDLRADPHAALRSICQFLGMDPSEQQLAAAVAAGSLENGRRWERHYLGKIDSDNASFYRGDNADRWQTLFSDEHQEKFMSLSAPAMRLGGYL